MSQSGQAIVVGFSNLSPAQRAQIEALAAGRSVCYTQEHPSTWQGLLDDAEVVFGWPDPIALAESPACFLQLPSSGYDQYRVQPLLQKRQFLLANSRGVVARAVAEHCLAFMLAFNRNLPAHWRRQSTAHWQREPEYRLLQDQVLAIVGMGAIGTELAAIAHALGMRVLAINRSPCLLPGAEYIPLNCLDQAIPLADHVALTMAPPAESGPLFGASRIACMKPSAYLYNLARGSVLDESALLAALQQKRIAGAALDVFSHEPLPPSSPLWQLPNVQITPHIGGRFCDENARLLQLFLDNLRLYLNHEPLQNLVIGMDQR